MPQGISDGSILYLAKDFAFLISSQNAYIELKSTIRKEVFSKDIMAKKMVAGITMRQASVINLIRQEHDLVRMSNHFTRTYASDPRPPCPHIPKITNQIVANIDIKIGVFMAKLHPLGEPHKESLESILHIVMALSPNDDLFIDLHLNRNSAPIRQLPLNWVNNVCRLNVANSPVTMIAASVTIIVTAMCKEADRWL